MVSAASFLATDRKSGTAHLTDNFPAFDGFSYRDKDIAQMAIVREKYLAIDAMLDSDGLSVACHFSCF